MENNKDFTIDNKNGNVKVNIPLNSMSQIASYYFSYLTYEYIDENYNIYSEDGELLEGKELDDFCMSVYQYTSDKNGKQFIEDEDLEAYCERFNYIYKNKENDNELSEEMLGKEEKVDKYLSLLIPIIENNNLYSNFNIKETDDRDEIKEELLKYYKDDEDVFLGVISDLHNADNIENITDREMTLLKRIQKAFNNIDKNVKNDLSDNMQEIERLEKETKNDGIEKDEATKIRDSYKKDKEKAMVEKTEKKAKTKKSEEKSI